MRGGCCLLAVVSALSWAGALQAGLFGETIEAVFHEAVTHVFLKNDGKRILCVGRTKTGLSRSHWKQPEGGRHAEAQRRAGLDAVYLVYPGERIEYLRLSREDGITSGESFLFATKVWFLGETEGITLRQKSSFEKLLRLSQTPPGCTTTERRASMPWDGQRRQTILCGKPCDATPPTDQP